MYLAEIHQAKRDFRLWRCPQCDGRRTNEEDLMDLAPRGIHNDTGKNAA